MPKSRKNTDTVAKVVDMFDQSWKYAESQYHKAWEDSWKLYNNQRIDQAYDGITNTFVPITFSTIETMVSALAGGKPKFDFIPTHSGQEADTRVLNALLDYYWDCDKWSIKVIHWIRSMLIYGTGVLYIYWDINKPRIINVPLRDFIVDPTANHPDDARYMGRRYLTTKSELEQFEVVNPDYDPEDPKSKEFIPRYQNLSRIKDGGSKGFHDTDKEQKDFWIGSTLGKDAREKQVEVIEIWTNETVYSVANRSILIEEADNPYKLQAEYRNIDNPEGLLPFIPQRNYMDESLFYGKSEIEPIKQAQELLNDLTNQNIDAVTYVINPMYTIDPMYADWIDEVENVPGAVYPFRKDALNPIKMPQIPREAFAERLNIKNEMRETTAVDQIVKGIQTAGDKTATEIQAQMAQAGQRFSLKVTQIENDGFHRLAQLVFQMIRLFVDEPMMVRVVGASGVEWAEYEPSAFMGEYEPQVQLESNVLQNEAVEAQSMQNLYAAFFNNPIIKQDELTKLVLQKAFRLDPDEVNKLIAPPPPLEGSEATLSQMGDMMAESSPTPMAGGMDMPVDDSTMGGSNIL